MTGTISIRRAGPSDADEISALFQLAYGESSHPFQFSENVARFSADLRNVQAVAEHDGAVLATMAMTYYPWNRSYEWGRGVTHPDARRLGLAEVLTQRVIELALLSGRGELYFGFPRLPRILDLCGLIRPAFITVGHDGGRNVANSRRETHLVACAVPLPSRLTHVAPAVPESARSRFIDETLYRPLGLRSAPGLYPSRTLVGPVSSSSRRVHGFDVEHDAASPDRALEFVKDHVAGSPAGTVARIRAAVGEYTRAEHISLTVLADKLPLIECLEADGFESAAYLPAWYSHGSSRYDCVYLAKRLRGDAPAPAQFEPLIDRFTRELRVVPAVALRLLESA